MLERRAFWYSFAALALCAATAFARYRSTATLHLTAHLNDVSADGRWHDLIEIQVDHHQKFTAGELSVSGATSAIDVKVYNRFAKVIQRVPVNPGSERLHVNWRGKAYVIPVTIPSDVAASIYAPDLPDWMPLHDPQDRESFVRWFTTLADRAASSQPADLPAEISDCAALLRFCFRESLRRHDDRWYATASELERLNLPSVEQWAYPDTPLHAALFRTRPGTFTPAQLSDGTFTQFADAKTLATANTFLVSRNLQDARPGDLLFYRLLQLDSHHNQQYHSMIITGAHAQWAVYHTGPINAPNGQPGKGEIRRVQLRDLLHHPDPRWRPLASNANFLGVYRWDILAEGGSSSSR